jgi:hypothetical protein
MWSERGISRLLFNIVPTDIDAFVTASRAWRTPVGKSRCSGYECPYGCSSVFTGGETAPFKCPLQSREEAEFAGRQVGTVGGRGSGAPNRRWQYGWPLLLPCGASHCLAEGWLPLWEGQVSSALPPLSVIAVHFRSPCLPGTYYFVVLF